MAACSIICKKNVETSQKKSYSAELLFAYHLGSRFKGNRCSGDDPKLTEAAESSIEEIGVLLG
jgi:hypothetical protein